MHGTKQVRFVVEQVSPARASELLHLNTGNFRPINNRRIILYAEEMRTGNWRQTLEPIKLDSQGTMLLDGQHRLTALIRADVTLQMVLAYGAEDGVYQMDRGQPRSIAQVAGHHGIKNTGVVCSMTKLVLLHHVDEWGLQQNRQFGDSVMVKFMLDHDTELQEAVRLARRQKHWFPQGVMGAVLYLGCEGVPLGDKRRAVAEWFVDRVSDGVGLGKSEPVLHLRNRRQNLKGGQELERNQMRWLITLAWNATVMGQPMKQLRLNTTGARPEQPPEAVLHVNDNVDNVEAPPY